MLSAHLYAFNDVLSDATFSLTGSLTAWPLCRTKNLEQNKKNSALCLPMAPSVPATQRPCHQAGVKARFEHHHKKNALSQDPQEILVPNMWPLQ